MSDLRPACENHDPEMWFPELPANVNQYSEKGKVVVERAVTALKLCNSCPLFANGWCDEDTFSNFDSVRYGISAGLTPVEKRRMIDFSMSDVSEPIFDGIRREATKQGIPVPKMTKREKPPKFYAINDMTVLRLREELRGE